MTAGDKENMELVFLTNAVFEVSSLRHEAVKSQKYTGMSSR